jgi:protein-disulfide isomerase
MGVNSTPSLIFDDGTLQPGYAPAKDLAAKLGIF